MKDIKDYFSSPIKTVNNNQDSVEQVEENKHDHQQTRKHKKKKKRKPSDPIVKDVTQLFSNNLTLTSPGSTSEVKILSIDISVKHSENTTNQPSPEVMTMKENHPCNNEINTETTKKNAFHFMMERRNRSIGMNSPGKELDKETTENIEIKQKLTTRRQIFLNWSEQKGSTKRKRLEEEKDEIIEVKLKRRAKRLKNLLKIEEPKERCTRKSDRTDRKKMKKLSSSESENSDFENDTIEFKKIDNEDEALAGKTAKKSKNLKRRAKRLKNLLKIEEPQERCTMKSDTTVRKKVSSSENENSHFENDIIEFKKIDNEDEALAGKTAHKSKNLKRREKRLKNLLKIEEPQERCTMKSDTTVRKKIKKVSSSENENSLFENDIIEFKKIDNEDEALAGKTAMKSKNLDKEIEKKNKEIEDCEPSGKQKCGNLLSFLRCENSGNSNINSEKTSKNQETHSKNKKMECIESKSKSQIVKISKSNKSSENSDSFNGEPEIKTDKKKHSKRKRKKIKKADSNLDESSQDSVNFTPRTLRSWKMRIKINIDEDTTKTEVRTDEKINYIELDTSDESGEASEGLLLSSDIEDKEKVNKSSKKAIKIAPVFAKATPKPKEDPAITEARKQFLMSGIPSSLKKFIEKQNSIAEQYNTFPITCHVQQKDDSQFWNLPPPELKLRELSPLSLSRDLECKNLTKSHIIRNLNIDTAVKKVDKLKVLLNKIKAENPNYPVYRSFRHIREKSGHDTEVKEETKTAEKPKRGRKKKNLVTVELKPLKTEIEPTTYAMWTDKYKPSCSDEIIGNSEAIKNLKKWLEAWKNLGQEISSKKRRRSRSSESEFEFIDSDSRESTKLPGKVILLGGPCGSGKSTAVYAICNELGFNVIELNASSKRTGKRLLQEIQEATQSHQVRKGDAQNLQNFFQSNPELTAENPDQQSDKKMCVVLLEDVDIIFEQDEGFTSAVFQLAATSKRPIIATTTDSNSINVQKFLNEFAYIPFLPLTSHSLGVWLQIVYLCEGLYVSQEETGSLLEYNKGDARKTLLDLQFWAQSGGQTVQTRSPVKIEYKRSSCEESHVDDSSDYVLGDSDVLEHKDCVRSFEILEIEEPFRVPYYLNLGLVWWNIPNMIGIPNFSKHRINKIRGIEKQENLTGNEILRTDSKQNDKRKMFLMTKVYDSLTFTDAAFKKFRYFDDNEPVVGKTLNLTDSLELNEVFDEGYADLECVHEMTHTLVNGWIKESTKDSGDCMLNFNMPDKRERRWRTKLEECENSYRDALFISIDKKSVALDYMPVLRTMTRSERNRATTNTKRGNRFRSYLRELGVNCNEDTTNIASSIFNSDFML